MRRNHPSVLAAVLTAVLAVLLAACGGGGDGEADTAVAGDAERVENEEIGVAVVIPPGSPFELVSNEGDEIRLHFAGDSDYAPGDVTYSAYPVQEYGVNLYEKVNQRKAELEALPDGQFFGQAELGSHLGAAFNTRGRYTADDGSEVEAVRIFAVHPSANRILYMTYTYPPAPGQTAARLEEQAFEAFGYIDPLAGGEGEGMEGEGEVGVEG
jgi:hypothetical protein